MAADLSPQLEGILFEMYRHELIAEAEDADDCPAGPCLRSRGAAMAMLTPAGQLRAHRITEQRLDLLAGHDDAREVRE